MLEQMTRKKTPQWPGGTACAASATREKDQGARRISPGWVAAAELPLKVNLLAAS